MKKQLKSVLKCVLILIGLVPLSYANEIHHDRLLIQSLLVGEEYGYLSPLFFQAKAEEWYDASSGQTVYTDGNKYIAVYKPNQSGSGSEVTVLNGETGEIWTVDGDGKAGIDVLRDAADGKTPTRPAEADDGQGDIPWLAARGDGIKGTPPGHDDDGGGSDGNPDRGNGHGTQDPDRGNGPGAQNPGAGSNPSRPGASPGSSLPNIPGHFVPRNTRKASVSQIKTIAKKKLPQSQFRRIHPKKSRINRILAQMKRGK